MLVIDLSIKEAAILQDSEYYDHTGSVISSFDVEINKANFSQKIINPKAQDIVKSNNNVFRGLHLQINKPQSRFIRLLSGKIILFLLDLRDNGDYLKTEIINLYKENEMVFVPENCASGYLSLDDNTKVIITYNNTYEPLDEITIDPYCIKEIKEELEKHEKTLSKRESIVRSFRDKNAINTYQYQLLINNKIKPEMVIY